jgi:hypothetical protein
MPQFDFGTIDPNVVDGTQLAGFLNNWRDALYSLQRGGTRASFVVPGQLWINDAGGASAWKLNWYVSPTIGDVTLFTLDTTTGNVTISAAGSGSLSAAVLLAQAAASPSVQWNATGNPIDAKNWRMTVNAAGALVLSSYNDAGVLQQSFTFNRDGTMAAGGWRVLSRQVVSAAQANVRIQNIPADINDLMFSFDLLPTVNGVDLQLAFFDNTGALDNATALRYAFAVTAAAHTQAATAPVVSGSSGVSYTTSILMDYAVANRNVGNLSGIRGSGKIYNIRDAARFKQCDWQNGYNSSDGTVFLACTGGGARQVAGAITGFQLMFVNASNITSGSFEVWGSP